MFLGTVLASLAVRSPTTGGFLFWLSAFLIASGDVMIYAILVNQLSDKVSISHQGRMTGLIYIVITLIWTLTGVLGGHITAEWSSGTMLCSGFGVGLLLLSGVFTWLRI